MDLIPAVLPPRLTFTGAPKGPRSLWLARVAAEGIYGQWYRYPDEMGKAGSAMGKERQARLGVKLALRRDPVDGKRYLYATRVAPTVG